jgi:homocysteine S-methyltransferase
MTFLECLSERPLLADGAMGTLLHLRGVEFDECFDALNLTRPTIVGDVHRQYAQSGADVIETNTFGANRYKLAEHRLAGQVAELNRRAVEIAREAAGSVREGIFIAGSVGPLGLQLAPLGTLRLVDAYEAFFEQITALAEAGADLIILETFSDLREIEEALRAARAACALPVVAQLTFSRDDRTLLGNTPADAARRLRQLGAAVIGANCSTGPRRMLEVVNAMREALEKEDSRRGGVEDGAPTAAQSAPFLLSAMPNAGFPERRGERVMYPATPEYFGEYTRRFVESGARLVGGCCGTTPDHIRAMRWALDALLGQPIRMPPVTRPGAGEARAEAPAEAAPEPTRYAAALQPTQLARALAAREFVITVEVEPPKSADTAQIEEIAYVLREAGATVLDISDAPMARMRMSALAVAHRVQERASIETVLHFPVRGRNLLRVQGDLLAAHALNIRNVFVVMGDPTSIGDYPQAYDKHDIVPTGLAQLIKERFNRGVDGAGSSIGRPCAFQVGMAVSLTPADLDKEAALLRKKVECGADFLLSQPVFDPARAAAFLDHYRAAYGELKIPILAGLLPLASARHAEFLRNEVPGVVIPDTVVERLGAAANKARAEGALIARETLAELRPLVRGAYIIPAFGRYDLVAALIRDLRDTLRL